MMSTFGRSFEATLVDALSRGALTCTDLGGLTGRELNALYHCGQKSLANEQTQQAVLLFSLATELMPYQARFWRALGVSLHRLGDFSEACAAYRAALYLFPDHPQIQTYLAEASHLLANKEATGSAFPANLTPLPKSSEPQADKIDVRSHSKDLSSDARLRQGPSIGPALEALMNAEELTLTDGRVLPLDHFDRDAISFATNPLDKENIDLTPKERTALTKLAIGELEAAQDPSPMQAEITLGSRARENQGEAVTNEPTPTDERTLAFRLRLSAVSLDDEVTQTRSGTKPLM